MNENNDNLQINGEYERCGNGESITGAASSETSEINLRYESKQQLAKSALLGAFIGLAVIVPGVSGSAVAIIFRLYEKLLYALGNLLKEFKRCVRFLLPIAAGAVAGLILGFFGVRELLNILPFAIVALFAGLMLGAFPSVTDQLKGQKLTVSRAILFLAGFVLPIAVSAISVFASSGTMSLEGLRAYHYILFIVLGGVVAVTQLVPGLSATALLMMVGCFSPLMNSVSIGYWRSNPSIFLVYACLALGFVLGLPTVSKLMSLLLKRRRAPTFYTIAGLSLGSVATMFFNSEIISVYRSWMSGGAVTRDVVLGAVLFVFGVAAAYFFVRFERKRAD